MHDISALIPNDQLLVKEKILKSKLHALWKNEEIYWKQRSRVRWLREGDRNSKFFHQTTLDRRMRNKIVQIRDSEGAWLEEEVSIMEEVHAFYSRLFRLDSDAQPGQRVGYEILDCLSRDVTESMNASLTREVSDGEI